MSSFNYWQDFPEIWRFEECGRLLDAVKSGSVVFFDEIQSNALWSICVSPQIEHLMEVKNSDDIFKNVEKYDVCFDDKDSADLVFERFLERAGHLGTVIVFFCKHWACILEFNLLRQFWNEIFLPSDETTIVVDIYSRSSLFSFEDRFFVATMPPN